MQKIKIKNVGSGARSQRKKIYKYLRGIFFVFDTAYMLGLGLDIVNHRSTATTVSIKIKKINNLQPNAVLSTPTSAQTNPTHRTQSNCNNKPVVAKMHGWFNL